MPRRGRSRPKLPIQFRGAAQQQAANTITTATQTSTALAIPYKKSRVLGIANETDLSVGFGATAVDTATQTNTAIALTRNKRKTIGIVTQTNLSRPITSRKTLGMVSETDTARSITPSTPTPPPGPVTIWRVDIHGLNGNPAILSGLAVQSWMMNWVLNAPGAFEADVQLTHAQATETNLLVGAREIRVYRSTSLVWAGYLWSVTADPVNYKLRLRGEGYFSRLRRRIIASDQLKKDKDQADIAWDLIQYTQSTHGTLGFTDGHTDTGVLIDHAYCATDKNLVGDSIEELSEMDNSFDFWITPTVTDGSNKVFKTAVPRRGTTKAFTINQDNAISADYEIDATDLANRIWGVGNGECNPPDFEANAAASIATYGELHDTIEFDDLDHLPSVKAHTREEIRLRKQPRRQVTVRMEERDITWGAFDVGDIITLASNRGYLTDSRQMRVLRIQVNFEPENKIGFYEIELDSVIGA